MTSLRSLATLSSKLSSSSTDTIRAIAPAVCYIRPTFYISSRWIFSTPTLKMPPKTTKRKEMDPAGSKAKKAKVERGISSNSASAPTPDAGKGVAPEEIPRNTTVPEDLKYDKRPDGQIRIACWNVTSINTSKEKGLFRYLEAEDADVLVLSETKINELKPVEIASDMKPLRDQYPYRYWGIGAKKGYAGVAILSKIKPIRKEIGLPGYTSADSTGRLITLEFENTYIIGTYVVNGGEGLKKMPDRRRWNSAFASHLAACDREKPVIWCGDLNVVLDQRDLSDAKGKWNKRPGYTEEECEAHRAILNASHEHGGTGQINKFQDVWREKFHTEEANHYTYYGSRGACRSKGLGWRLDSFIVSDRLVKKTKQCEIRHEVYGASDHVPVICDIEGPL